MALIRLLGYGIAYSASPLMQQAALDSLGLAHRYELADVPAEQLVTAIDGLRLDDSLGANVTTPHKGAVLELLDGLEPLARDAAAVNTIVRRGRRLVGVNTDVPAILDEIAQLRPRPASAVVLGAGGAARAAALALQLADAGQVTVVARRAGDSTRPWGELPALLRDADLLVNATPVGTGADATPVDPADLHPALAVLDLVYRPSPTRLVADARAAGAPARGGAGVLLGQGRRSLEAWLDAPVPPAAVAAMVDALRQQLGAAADV